MATDTTSAGSELDRFRYGWRYVKRVSPDGLVEWDQVPLTLEDTLHPDEEDVIPGRPRHEMQCRYLGDVFRQQRFGEPIDYVSIDLRIDWGVEGIRPHSPDLAVFWNLQHEPDLDDGTLYLAEAGGRCVLALEIVSPDLRDNDVVHKFRHYHRIGIPLYVIVDQEEEGGPQTLRGYRWTPAEYVPLALDEQGRLYLEPLRLYLLLREDELLCQDAETGKELGSYAEITRQLEEADRKIEEAKQAIETLTLQEREQRLARETAEKQAKEQAEALEVARKQAQQKTEALTAADARIRELEAILQRLQNQTPSSETPPPTSESV